MTDVGVLFIKPEEFDSDKIEHYKNKINYKIKTVEKFDN